ncbi:MAG TPA: hypothetical protein VI757_00790, partial [Bacteroidia bacterium]|nr:hypothetical protein [Bacteroidia bacterium]
MNKRQINFVLALVISRRLNAVLDFPRDIDDFITYARGIHASMAASAYFAALAPKLSTLLTNIGKLEASHTALQTHPPTTTTLVRDGDLLIVQNNLRGL